MFAARILVTAMFFAAILGTASAQNPGPTTTADLAKYTGSDRARLLYDGAKKEGKLVWYTSLTAYKEIVKIFESKYPGVSVETYRTSGADIATKALEEARSKRYLADAIETSPSALMQLRDAQLLAAYMSPYLAEYPDASKQKAPGGLVYWATDRESYIGVGYNKKLIPAADVPKNFEDLLKPALKGKMAISNDAIAALLIGAMVKAKGESFLKRLRNQDVTLHGVTGPGFNELIVSGEVPLSFTAIHSNIGHSVDNGASVAWVPMDLVAAIAGGTGAFTHAQHPYAALLLVDFFLSPEGQKMLEEKFKHGSPLKNYGFKKWYAEENLTTSQFTEAMDRWQRLVSDLKRR